MEQILFWTNWLTAPSITALLVFWSLPLSPFTHPGTTANEATIVFLLVTAIRWATLATALALVIIAWGYLLGLAIHSIIALTLGVLFLHVVLGTVNFGVINAWLSVSQSKTRAINAVYAVIYFTLPILMLLFTAYLMIGNTNIY